MIKFKEFLNEEEDLSLLPGLSKIKEECSQALHLFKETNLFLYRGMRNQRKDKVFAKDQISGRLPSDSTRGFNVMFNAGISSAFNVDMIRANCLFCTADHFETFEYGASYFVFPVGGFNGVWSEDIRDSFVDDDIITKKFANDLFGKASDFVRIQMAFQELFEQSSFSINKAVLNFKTNDILVEECFNKAGIDRTADEIERSLRKTFEDLYIKGNLADALHAKKEILLFGQRKNYFVPLDLIIEHIATTEDLEGQSPEEFLSNFFFSSL